MSNGSDEHAIRPSPEALLAEARKEHRGRLKVFLGAVPGVGKTYAMLQAARQRKSEGVDVVAGLVETHGRAETQALLEGVEIIPRRQVEYRGTLLNEMDLDAVLARRPQLVLVDELAHTNAPGSRHPKRHLDVEELIAAGIDVFTTVNIQHLESLNDTVAAITGVRVRETLPDRLLEEADDIQLIDLPPEELLQRLREGKVYVPQQIERAIGHFFRPGNINALRELALRRTAERVDRQMQGYMRTQAIPGPWPTTDRIMVCVSPSPLSARLVRTVKRRADRRGAAWVAVYVETPAHQRLSDADRDRVDRTLRLAESLGGEAVSTPGRDVAEDLVQYARTRNATEIVIGKSGRSWWQRLRHGSIVDALIRKSGPIDIYVVAGEETWTPRADLLMAPSPAELKPTRYLAATGLVVAAAAIAKLLGHFAGLPNISLVLLVGVLLTAVWFGLWPSIYASLLGLLVYDFFFVQPLHTFSIASPQDVLAIFVFLVVAVLTSNLTARLREQTEAAKRREDRTSALFALSRALAGATALDSIAQVIVSQVSKIVGERVVILLPERDRLIQKLSHPLEPQLSETEAAAATWAWEHNQLAGAGSDTLPGVPWLFMPLRTGQDTVGVIGVESKGRSEVLSPRRQRLLEGLADQAAIAVERVRLVQEMQQARLQSETEKLRNAMLSSISHDLKTPLASIIGSASSLLGYGQGYDERARRDLLATIQEEAERLDRFVSNLLDITRIESGRLEPKREWAEIGDVIGTALARLQNVLNRYRVDVEIEPDLPLLRLDFVLVEQVFINVLENAAKYSPPGSTITVKARREQEQVAIEIDDEGVGIPAGDLERVFDKFYRVRHADRQIAGTGLGLSIARGFVEAHGGTISAGRPRGGTGTRITVTFPVEEQPRSAPQHEQVAHD
jgi:two-component system, OmpR family, sensor histidine kinase KdpD